MDKSIISEIKEITAIQVAKKQDAAKLNFPNLIDLIKIAAGRGESSLTLPEDRINEYDLKLLKEEGFRVMFIDKPKPKYPNEYKSLSCRDEKVWEIAW